MYLVHTHIIINSILYRSEDFFQSPKKVKYGQKANFKQPQTSALGVFPKTRKQRKHGYLGVAVNNLRVECDVNNKAKILTETALTRLDHEIEFL